MGLAGPTSQQPSIRKPRRLLKNGKLLRGPGETDGRRESKWGRGNAKVRDPSLVKLREVRPARNTWSSLERPGERGRTGWKRESSRSEAFSSLNMVKL